MEDRTQEALEKYELEIINTRKARGGLLLETSEGLYLYSRTGCGERRLGYENEIKKHLIQKGYERVDLCLENKQGCFITKDGYGETYIVKKWYSGEECNLHSISEIRRAAENLGLLHQLLTGVPLQKAEEDLHIQLEAKRVEETELDQKLPAEEKRTVYIREPESLPVCFERRNRELKRLFRYIYEKKKRNSFEVLYLKVFWDFYESCEEALSRIKGEFYQVIWEETKEKQLAYHGSYNQHKVLFSGKETATIDFSQSQIGLQIMDLYHFLRKTMEKNGWDFAIAKELLSAYQKQRKIKEEEWRILSILLLYPEKFWKTANYYYNTRKSWLSERTVKKLEENKRQLFQRMDFLKQLEDFYIGTE